MSGQPNIYTGKRDGGSMTDMNHLLKKAVEEAALAASAAEPDQDETPAAKPRKKRAESPAGEKPKKPTPRTWRPSNILIETALDVRLNALKDKLSVSQGDLVIIAVETEQGELSPYAHAVGGGLFEARPAASKGVDVETKNLRPWTFRLREADYEVLDRLTAEHQYPNRKEFIVACLKALCDRHGIPS